MTGRLIADERKSLGMTQAELAKKCGLTQPMIARYEGGYPVPTANLKTIAKVLGLSIDDLKRKQRDFSEDADFFRFDEHRFNQLLKEAKSYPLEEKHAIFQQLNLAAKVVKFKEMLRTGTGIVEGIKSSF